MRSPIWRKARRVGHWRDREYQPALETVVRWKRVVWFKSGVAEIRDDRYRWCLRLVGVSDPRRPVVRLGSLTHEEAVMALRKIERVAGGGATTPGGAPADAEHYPTLWEHLSCSRFEDGSPRELSTMVIVGGMAEWRGCLSDKANQRVCWKTASTLEGLLFALENAAANEEPRDWRAAAEQKQKKRN